MRITAYPPYSIALRSDNHGNAQYFDLGSTTLPGCCPGPPIARARGLMIDNTIKRLYTPRRFVSEHQSLRSTATRLQVPFPKPELSHHDYLTKALHLSLRLFRCVGQLLLGCLRLT